MKKTIFLSLGLVLIFLHPSVKAVARENELRQKIRQNIKREIRLTTAPTIKALKENFKYTATLPAKIRKEIKEKNQGLLERVKNQVKEMVRRKLKFAARLTGKITAIGENRLTITDNEGKSYSVLVTDKTQLRRRFWGKAAFNEFKVGHEVKVIGRYTNEEKTEIEAILIRNLSVQKRWGVFFGEVVSVMDNSLVIKTKNQDQLTVYLTSSTKIVNRKEEPITISDIKTGHRIRVKGVGDKDLKEIREVEEIKDFSLPPFLRPTLKQE